MGDSAGSPDLAAASASAAAAALASPCRLLRATPERMVILAQRSWSGSGLAEVVGISTLLAIHLSKCIQLILFPFCGRLLRLLSIQVASP